MNDGAPYTKIVGITPFCLRDSRYMPGPWEVSSGSGMII